MDDKNVFFQDGWDLGDYTKFIKELKESSKYIKSAILHDIGFNKKHITIMDLSTNDDLSETSSPDPTLTPMSRFQRAQDLVGLHIDDSILPSFSQSLKECTQLSALFLTEDGMHPEISDKDLKIFAEALYDLKQLRVLAISGLLLQDTKIDGYDINRRFLQHVLADMIQITTLHLQDSDFNHWPEAMWEEFETTLEELQDNLTTLTIEEDNINNEAFEQLSHSMLMLKNLEALTIDWREGPDKSSIVNISDILSEINSITHLSLGCFNNETISSAIYLLNKKTQLKYLSITTADLTDENLKKLQECLNQLSLEFFELAVDIDEEDDATKYNTFINGIDSKNENGINAELTLNIYDDANQSQANSFSDDLHMHYTPEKEVKDLLTAIRTRQTLAAQAKTPANTFSATPRAIRNILRSGRGNTFSSKKARTPFNTGTPFSLSKLTTPIKRLYFEDSRRESSEEKSFDDVTLAFFDGLIFTLTSPELINTLESLIPKISEKLNIATIREMAETVQDLEYETESNTEILQRRKFSLTLMSYYNHRKENSPTKRELIFEDEDNTHPAYIPYEDNQIESRLQNLFGNSTDISHLLPVFLSFKSHGEGSQKKNQTLKVFVQELLHAESSKDFIEQISNELKKFKDRQTHDFLTNNGFKLHWLTNFFNQQHINPHAQEEKIKGYKRYSNSSTEDLLIELYDAAKKTYDNIPTISSPF